MRCRIGLWIISKRGLSSSSTYTSSSIDPSEVLKFSKASHEWWNPSGEFELLHRMNPVRVGYIRDILTEQNGLLTANASPDLPFKGLNMLDVGCGGGLLSEALARLGGSVTGIDASPENIGIAKAHAQMDPHFKSNPIKYECRTAESLTESSERFDVVLSMEVIEHVKNPDVFVQSCSNLLKPDGFLFLSTINRTLSAYVFTILAAEYILGLVPRGTHDFSKYITPEELESWIRNNGCSIIDTTGLHLNPISKEWSLSAPIKCFGERNMNYMTSSRKLKIDSL